MIGAMPLKRHVLCVWRLSAFHPVLGRPFVTVIHQLGILSPLSLHLRKNEGTIFYLHPVSGINCPATAQIQGPVIAVYTSPQGLQIYNPGQSITPDEPGSLMSITRSAIYVADIAHCPSLPHVGYCFTYGITSHTLPGSWGI